MSISLLMCVVLCLVAQLCLILCDPMDYCSPRGSSVHGDSLGKNIWSGLPCPPPENSPTQGLDPGLPHCRQILYQLSHQESPRILEWVAYSFSRGYSQPRYQTGASCIAVDSLAAELPGNLVELIRMPKNTWWYITNAITNYLSAQSCSTLQSNGQ